MSGFSIIIPTYNRATLLRAALGSVQELEVPDSFDVEILVIDNNSTDLTANVARQANAKGPLPVRRIVEVKQGLNHGRNRGAVEAKFEHLVYLDDDILVDAGWLSGYQEALGLFQADCVVGPVEPYFEERPPPWMSQTVLRSVTSEYSLKGDASLLLPRDRAHEIPGSNFGVSRAVVLQVGGFHPELDRSGKAMLAGGDFEFGERLVLLSKRVAYSPRCRVHHLVSRHKISVKGLRRRWEGLGATGKALMELRGQRLPFGKRTKLFSTMIFLFFESLIHKLIGHRGVALERELQARKLFGLLFKAPAIFPRDRIPRLTPAE